jgi:hypothetical protein
MVLNFMIVKSLPFRPGRGCLNQILPLLTIAKRIMQKSKSGEAITIAVRATAKSKTGFTKFLYNFEASQNYRHYKPDAL